MSISSPDKAYRIAVVLIGHSRFLGDDINRVQYPLHLAFIDFFAKISIIVDYYVLSWENVDYNTNIKTSIQFEHLWPNKSYYCLYSENALDFDRNNKTLKLCWLAKQAAEQIKIVQNTQQFQYDYIIESRLDQFITSKDTPIFYELKNDEIIADIQKDQTPMPLPHLYKRKNWNPKLDPIKTFVLSGWYFRMNPTTYFKFSNRFDFFVKNQNLGYNYHQDLGYYFLENNKFIFYTQHDFQILSPFKQDWIKLEVQKTNT
jgi:hypothetical protein